MQNGNVSAKASSEKFQIKNSQKSGFKVYFIMASFYLRSKVMLTSSFGALYYISKFLPMQAFSEVRLVDWPVILQSLEHITAVGIPANLVIPAKHKCYCLFYIIKPQYHGWMTWYFMFFKQYFSHIRTTGG